MLTFEEVPLSDQRFFNFMALQYQRGEEASRDDLRHRVERQHCSFASFSPTFTSGYLNERECTVV